MKWDFDSITAHNQRLIDEARKRRDCHAPLAPAITAASLIGTVRRTPAPKRNDGKSLEADLTRSIYYHEARGYLTAEKVDPPTRVIYRDGKPAVIHLANPFLDFTGTLTTHGGRSLFIEAKSTKPRRLPLAKDEGGLTGKQLDAMRRWQSAGAFVALIWRCEETDRAALITLREIEHALTTGKHLKHDDHPEMKTVLNGQGQKIYLLGEAIEKKLLAENPCPHVATGRAEK